MVLKMAEGLRVVDADSHMTERHDLFTERAPKGCEDMVPHVERSTTWTCGSSRARRSARPARGARSTLTARSTPLRLPKAGHGASTMSTRRRGTPRSGSATWTRSGIDTQVIYPNTIGLGGQNLWNSVR